MNVWEAIFIYLIIFGLINIGFVLINIASLTTIEDWRITIEFNLIYALGFLKITFGVNNLNHSLMVENP